MWGGKARIVFGGGLGGEKDVLAVVGEGLGVGGESCGEDEGCSGDFEEGFAVEVVVGFAVESRGDDDTPVFIESHEAAVEGFVVEGV